MTTTVAWRGMASLTRAAARNGRVPRWTARAMTTTTRVATKPLWVRARGGRAASAPKGPALARALHRRATVAAAHASDLGHMDVAEASEMLSLDDWHYIDCRTEEEFRDGHVAGSINIPVVFFTEQGMVANAKFADALKAAVPDRETKLIMGCKVGQRSIMAGHLALNEQYDEVYNLTGGFDQWKAQGLPYEA